MNWRDREATPEQVKAAVQTICDRVAEKMKTVAPRIDPSTSERHEAVMEEVGVPSRYRTVTFETSKPLAALTRAQQFVTLDLPAGRCLVLSGPPSAGKTHAACCVLAAAKGTPRRMYYTGDIAGTLLLGGRESHLLLDVLEDVKFLVIDDLGVEYRKAGGVLETHLDRVFYKREAAQLATIITTNLPPSAIKDRYGERIVDRLRSWGEIFLVAGEGLRSDELPTWVTEP